MTSIKLKVKPELAAALAICLQDMSCLDSNDVARAVSGKQAMLINEGFKELSRSLSKKLTGTACSLLEL
jgi:hypothetical protein